MNGVYPPDGWNLLTTSCQTPSSFPDIENIQSRSNYSICLIIIINEVSSNQKKVNWMTPNNEVIDQFQSG